VILLQLYSRIRTLLLILLVAIIYFILARIGLLSAFKLSNATPVWPPSGFAFALVLLLGYRIAPGILLGAFAVNVFTFLTNRSCDPVTAIWVSALISIGNTAEALAGYYLLNRLGNINNFFRKVKVVFRFLFVALVMCLASCTIGSTAVLLGKIIIPANYFIVWFT
jgi:integral membrane sensor domain MASE1